MMLLDIRIMGAWRRAGDWKEAENGTYFKGICYFMKIHYVVHL